MTESSEWDARRLKRTDDEVEAEAEVKCDICEAEPGEHCTFVHERYSAYTAYGKDMPVPHSARVRKYLEELDSHG